MVFNSFAFLIFFPVVAAVYYLLPLKGRNVWLLVASYFFYMYWSPVYGLLLLYSTAASYAGGIAISRAKTSAAKKTSLAICLIMCFSPLIYYKYANFIMGSVNDLFLDIGAIAPFNIHEIILPIGISFFTFQAVGYVIDVYRNDTAAEKDFIKFALFVSFFPQLVAGPIERSRNLLGQFDKKASFDYDNTRDGIWLILKGFFMKVVIADRIALFVDFVYSDTYTYGGVYLIIASVLFALQIYCDFAGYSTIAVGTAQILGIRLMDNFSSPYLSVSVSEFWRRWHISLTTWFRDYVYIPLGGNRKGKIREYVNKLFVFTLSGMWHGADWSFAVWGALNGLWLVLEQILGRIFRFKFVRTQKPAALIRVICAVITFILVDITWIFFRADSVSDALYVIGDIAHTSNWNVLFDGSVFKCGLDAANFLFLILMIFTLFVMDALSKRGIMLRKKTAGLGMFARSALMAAAIAFIMLFGIWGKAYEAEAFIYFQF